MLALMVGILVAISVPSYMAMRERSNDSSARVEVRRAAEALEAYRAEHGTYVVAPAVLARYDAGLGSTGYRLVRGEPNGYCVEATVGGRTWHLAGPAGDVARGACP